MAVIDVPLSVDSERCFGDDTITRLRAYREAGADVLYAPGLVERDQIGTVVAAVGAPVNVLALPPGPPVHELGRLGVRRVSTGGALAGVAYAAMLGAARELLGENTAGYGRRGMTKEQRAAAF